MDRYIKKYKSILFILLLALLLRLISLNQSLWLDEATSALVVHNMGFGQMLSQFMPGDFHPPLYYLLLKGWGSLFGSSEVGLRSLSVLAGVSSVWLIYLIAKELKGDGLGVARSAALLLATSGLHIYFSQEARMYVLASFFVTVAFYFFVKIQKRGGVGEWLGFAVSLALLTMTHYLTLLVLPVFWIIGFLTDKKISWWKKFFASHLVLLVAWAFWLPTFLKQLGGGLGVEATSPFWWNILGRTTIKETLLVPTKFILGRISLENKVLYCFVAGTTGIVFGYLLLRAAKMWLKTRTIWLWLMLPVAIAALIGFRIPVFSYFRLLFVLPAFYLLLAFGISTLDKKWSKIALAFVLMVNLFSSGAYLFNEKFQREDWRGLVRFIRKESGDKRSITLFVADSQMEAYRYYAPDVKIVGQVENQGRFYLAGPQGLKDDFDTIWLMRYVQSIFDPEDKLRLRIEDLGYQKKGEYDFNGVVVWRYEK